MEASSAGRRRQRLPTEEERLLWQRAMQGTRPLHATAAEPAPVPAPVPPAPPPPAAVPAAPLPRPGRAAPPPSPPPPVQPARLSRRLDPHGPAGLDRRSWQRLRRGRMAIEGRLDLHGLTQVEAHDVLGRFLAMAQGRGWRCVLVITGRGQPGGGLLRAMTPRWLDEPPQRDRVVSYAPAQLRHGGEGALYVLLRRLA